MDEQNTNNLAGLLEQGKYNEVKKVIENMLSVPLTKQEKGEIAFNKAMTYIRARNAMNKDFIVKARQILKDMDDLEQERQAEAKEQKLQELRERIKDL